MKKMIFLYIGLSLFFALQSVATANFNCEAPDTYNPLFVIDNPSCEDKWNITIFMELYYYSQFRFAQDILTAKIDNELNANQIRKAFIETVKHSANLYQLNGEKNFKAVMAIGTETNIELFGKWFNNDFADIWSSAAGAAAATIIEGGNPQHVLSYASFEFVNMLNNLWSTFKIKPLAKNKQEILIAREFLHKFYQCGGNYGVFARSYGLPATADRDDLIGAIAGELNYRNPRLWFDDYDVSEINRIIDECTETVNAIRIIFSIPTGTSVAIVMDVSGSMSQDGKLETAKAAANSYIDLASDSSFVSLASFASDARSVVGILPIALGEDELKKGVHSLSASGGTNIGAGLEVGLSQLHSGSEPPKNPTIILLSDGINNRGEVWPAVERCKERGVKILTVPFGKDADHETLQKIAQMTDGRVSTADSKNLSYVFHRLNSQIQNRSTLFAGNDILKPGQQLSYSAHVDPDVSKLTFFTSWQGSRVLMELTDPTGNKIIPGKSSGRYIEEPTYSIFEIDSQPGPWQMSIEGRDFPAEGEQVNISISGQSSLYTNFLSFQPEYSPGSKVPIAVEMAKVKGLEKTPLTDVKVTAQIRKPQVAIAEKTGKGMKINLEGLIKSALDKKDITLPLYASGTQSEYQRSPQAGFGCAASSTPARTYEHPDIPGMKDDGVFANTFYDTNVKGSYLVNVTIEGMLDGGQQIKRQITESFQVGPIEDNTVTLSDFLGFGR
jgi:uncharacterized protein YegL